MRFWLGVCAALVTMAVTASMGRWQLDRAAQKTEMQRIHNERMGQPTWSASDLLAQPDPAVAAYRLAELRGQWMPEATVFLDNRPMAGKAGFVVLTPLRLSASGQAVVVQRGWVPRDFLDRTRLPTVQTPTGDVLVKGRLAPAPSQLYEPAPSPPGVIRQNVELVSWSKELGVPLLATSLQQTGASEQGLLREWPQPALNTAKHHGYAFQWFALCALTGFLTIWFLIIAPWAQSRRANSR